MSLDRGYTYGRRPSRAASPAKPLWRRTWFLAVVGALAVLIIGVNLLAPKAAGPQPAAPPAAPVTAAPTPTPEPGHSHDTGAPRAAWTAVNTFLNGWTSPDKATRAKVFTQTALPALAEGLADTSEENIVQDPIAGMDVISASPYSVEFRVWIVGDDIPVWMLLTSGHATGSSPYDWRVVEIEQRPVHN